MKTKFKNILLSSIILSLVLIIYTVIGYVFETNQEKWYSLLSIVIAAFAIFSLQRYYQKLICLNTASFKKLFVDTLYIILLSSFFINAFSFVYLKFISPEEIENMLVMAKNTLYEAYSGILSDAQIEQSYEMSAKFLTPTLISVFGFFGTFVQFFIIDIISAAINKQKIVVSDQKIEDENNTSL